MGKARANNKETRGLLRAIELEGGRVVYGKSGHWKIYVRNGDGRWHLLTTVASTPSDVHGRRNAIRQLRRHGFVLEKL